MAKKKTEKSETAAPKSPAKKAAAPTNAAKPAKPQAASFGTPMIDTSLAAAAAARMLSFNRRQRDEKSEGSSMVKQIKSELNKSHSNAVSNVLNKSAPEGSAKPSNLPFDQKKQVGHNQTFGPDVTRTGVPRRTSSG
jgi:hypothetical protein